MRPATATIPIYEIIFLGDRQGLEPMTIRLKRKYGVNSEGLQTIQPRINAFDFGAA